MSFLWFSVTLALQLTPSTAPSAVGNALVSGERLPERYEIVLSAQEFSVLHSAAHLGVSKYGGDATFNLQIAKRGNDVVWIVATSNPRLLEMWQYWMAEKTTELVNVLDFAKLDSNSKVALETVKAVNAKLVRARANPIWDPVRLIGAVQEEDGACFIQTEARRYRATGPKAAQLKPFSGRSVIATGFIKVLGEIELTSLFEKKADTLELFVMSLCPFGRQAESNLVKFLASRPAESNPNLEVHYIFYKREEAGKAVYTSLHGEPEVEEDLIQIVLRDRFAHVLSGYLLARATRDDPWEKLAAEAGMTPAEIDLVKNAVVLERDALIQAEYEHATLAHQVYDGSPTYVWEAQRVPDLRRIKPFEDLEASPQTCDEHK